MKYQYNSPYLPFPLTTSSLDTTDCCVGRTVDPARPVSPVQAVTIEDLAIVTAHVNVVTSSLVQAGDGGLVDYHGEIEFKTGFILLTPFDRNLIPLIKDWVPQY